MLSLRYAIWIPVDTQNGQTSNVNQADNRQEAPLLIGETREFLMRRALLGIVLLTVCVLLPLIPCLVSGVGDARAAGDNAGPGNWPKGMEFALLRFIRMEYSGTGWDDGVDATSRADVNLLDNLRKVTGFNVATNSERHPIRLLAKYDKGYAPPFVYITGSRGIRVSDRDVQIMREYLVDGGMLFADCGSPQWHESFREFIKQVFPGESLTNIPKDDVIFQRPFALTNGAPSVRDYGGKDAMGVKYKGRWAVFYHPGHIADAWKTEHPGIDESTAKDALSMGVNIVHYAFSNYLEETQKYRQR